MASTPHILAISLPLQGHINPILQLCNRLVSKGIRVTYVTTSSYLEKLQQQEANGNLITIETVPDSAPEESESEGLDMFEIFFRTFLSALTKGLPVIIDKYSNSGEPVTAILYDSCLPWMPEFAREKGLKGAVLFTQPAAVCSVFYHVYKGSLEILHDEASESEVSLPGLPVMGVRDLPSVLYDVGGYGAILRVLVDQFSTFEKADWRLFNTFDKLEDEVLKWLGKECKILTVGPTIPSMYTDKRIQGNYDYGLCFFKPKTESFIKWLDSKKDNSVVYVSFGSMASLSEKQMEEMALGLIESRFNFLWVVRETEQSKLPQNLKDGLVERGLIVEWCDQLQVLSHHAVGCFFSHGGWNSTLEALVSGVAVVVMPQWTDQPMNAKMISDVWGTGVRVRGGGRGEVVACLKEVMEGERGGEIRRNVLKWKELAVEAVGEGGSSDQNITEFAAQLFSTCGNTQKQESESHLS